MKKTIFTLTLLLLASPVFAGSRACTAALVTAGICANATDRLLFYSLPNVDPDGGGPLLSLSAELVEAIAAAQNYQATVPCTQALITAGSCASGQLGQLISNPESKASFADRRIRQDLASYLKRYREATEEAAKQTRLQANPAPEEIGQ